MNQSLSPLSVEIVVNVPLDKVWEYWNSPQHITRWAFATDSWMAPFAKNDLRVGGKFITTMSAKDQSESFDFTGTYTLVKENSLIEYIMDDGRQVSIQFLPTSDGVQITEVFDPETENSYELQRTGWQSILNNFKKYAESQN